MLEQALTALAAAGGAAVVQAAGTDAWTGLRQAVARWFGSWAAAGTSTSSSSPTSQTSVSTCNVPPSRLK
ncbi:hypothetical protein ACWDE9_44675, partial [Streptomyces olivaceoviridis]